jgi:hypothetical protein
MFGKDCINRHKTPGYDWPLVLWKDDNVELHFKPEIHANFARGILPSIFCYRKYMHATDLNGKVHWKSWNYTDSYEYK